MSAATEESRVLVVRAWHEPEHEHKLRIRILEPASRNHTECLLLTTRSSDAACDRVCGWLRAVEDGRVPP